MFVGGVNVDCLLEQRFSVFFFCRSTLEGWQLLMQHTFVGIPKFQLCKHKKAYMNYLIVENCHTATNSGNSKTLINVNRSK